MTIVIKPTPEGYQVKVNGVIYGVYSYYDTAHNTCVGIKKGLIDLYCPL